MAAEAEVAVAAEAGEEAAVAEAAEAVEAGTEAGTEAVVLAALAAQEVAPVSQVSPAAAGSGPAPDRQEKGPDCLPDRAGPGTRELLQDTPETRELPDSDRVTRWA